MTETLTGFEASLLALAVRARHRKSWMKTLLDKTDNPWVRMVIIDVFGPCETDAAKGLLKWDRANHTVHAPPKLRSK